MNHVDKDIFPLVRHHQALTKVTVPKSTEKIHYGLTSTRIPIRPTLGPDQGSCIAVVIEDMSDAHALVLKHIDGWSIAFNGDCRPR